MIYDFIEVLDDKEMIVSEDGKFGIVDYDGAVILPLLNDSINYLPNYSTEGLLLVVRKNKKNMSCCHHKIVYPLPLFMA